MSDHTPTQPITKLCSDEDILIHSGSDFPLLCPPWQQNAAGSDGSFASGQPWVLTSATVDFEAQGVQPNHVVQLTGPVGIYKSSGQFFAVESVSGQSVTLRRPYKAAGIGQPAAPSTPLTSVSFVSASFDPQISEATYDLYRRFNLDENTAAVGIQRSPAWVYDLQVFRVAAVYSVLYEMYVLNARSNKGDFDNKVDRFRQKLADAIDRIEVRWGPVGASSEPTAIFSCKLSR